MTPADAITVGDLFAGIGGFRLGLERAGGFDIKWSCEIDPYCRAVYAKHWPETMIYGDIRELRNPPYVDVLCGGFPCTDVSVAGKRRGITGPQSGLWSEFARLIGEVRPRYAFVENVPGLLSAGLGRVLGDLAEIGYDAEWDCIPASAVGAPHRRDRVWIVAYAEINRRESWGKNNAAREPRRRESDRGAVRKDVADPAIPRLEGQVAEGFIFRRGQGLPAQCDWWAVEPRLGELVDGLPPELAGRFIRVAKGCPDRVNKLRALGNAVVPAVVQWIGRRIIEHDAR